MASAGKKKTFPKKIEILLTTAEREKLKDQIVAIDQEIVVIKRGKKEDANKWRVRLSDKESEHKTLLKATETGTIEREVQAYEVRDDRRGHMVTYRADNDEQIDERPLTAEERQQDLFGKGNEAPDESTGPDGGKVVRITQGRKKAAKKSSKKPRAGADAED